jgi:hypothetical protein
MSCEKLDYLYGERKYERFNLNKYKDSLLGSGLLEPCAVKVARTVLRGEGESNLPNLPGGSNFALPERGANVDTGESVT